MKAMRVAIFAVSIFLVSCSAEKKLERRVRGTWTVAKYEEKNVTGPSGTSTNLGTIIFNKDKTGEKRISGITWRQTVREGSDFKWEVGDNTITIQSPSSNFAKTWIITRNKKSSQEWRSTSRGDVQTLYLKR